jgi:formylglycine-generating enzyme required for sulfatase activity
MRQKLLFTIVLLHLHPILSAQVRTDYLVILGNTAPDSATQETLLLLSKQFGYTVQAYWNQTPTEIKNKFKHLKKQIFQPNDQLLLMMPADWIWDIRKKTWLLTEISGQLPTGKKSEILEWQDMLNAFEEIPCHRKLLLSTGAIHPDSFPFWRRPDSHAWETKKKISTATLFDKEDNVAAFLLSGSEKKDSAWSDMLFQMRWALTFYRNQQGYLSYATLIYCMDQLGLPHPVWGKLPQSDAPDFFWYSDRANKDRNAANDLDAWLVADQAGTEAAYLQYRRDFCPGGMLCDAALAKIEAFPKPVLKKNRQIIPLHRMVVVEGGSITLQEEEGRKVNRSIYYMSGRPNKLDDYVISKYEVTQAEWRAVMGNLPDKIHLPDCDNCPVTNVSPYLIEKFCARLREISDIPYRLPSEAEWEFAAKGGLYSKGYLYSGSNDPDEVAWYRTNSNRTLQRTGLKKANELGIYDMSGNAQEMTADTWNREVKYKAGFNEEQKSSYVMRIQRGGSFETETLKNLTNSVSTSMDISYSAPTIGFRLAFSTKYLK